jgi:hypothetical protein
MSPNACRDPRESSWARNEALGLNRLTPSFLRQAGGVPAAGGYCFGNFGSAFTSLSCLV